MVQWLMQPVELTGKDCWECQELGNFREEKSRKKLLNSGSSFQEMPLVQVTVSERSVRHFHSVLVLLHWGASKAPSEEGTQVWFWPDPAGMFSDLYGILRWEP